MAPRGQAGYSGVLRLSGESVTVRPRVCWAKSNRSSSTMSAQPENANEECVGPRSTTAGTASSCAGCPNQAACASGAASAAAAEGDATATRVRLALSRVKRKLLVLSGKGGVGKSTCAGQLAFGLAGRGFHVSARAAPRARVYRARLFSLSFSPSRGPRARRGSRARGFFRSARARARASAPRSRRSGCSTSTSAGRRRRRSAGSRDARSTARARAGRPSSSTSTTATAARAAATTRCAISCVARWRLARSRSTP